MIHLKDIWFIWVVYFSLIFPSRESSAPYISGDSFRSIADHIYDETSKSLNPHKVKHNDTIFLKTDYMSEFFNKVHPKINNKYILITHNSDLGAPGEFEYFLDDSKITKWFGINPTIVYHTKFIPIPIGIANRYWLHGKLEDFNYLLKLKKATSKIGRDILLGINFEQSTNLNIRKKLYNKAMKLVFCEKLYSKDHKEYLIKMLRAKFILCPEGNGLDCHRTWECLLANAIPVLKSSYLDSIFTDLPVIIVNNWDEITEKFLNDKYIEINNRKFNNEKKYFNYWHEIIQNSKHSN